ncbi:plasmid partitioning protein RepB (plasmid) [Segnochrobactraceae bacterium EtOH-i3]
MARRNIFQNIKDTESAPAAERSPVPGYVARGAGRNMLSSIGELAQQAARAKDLTAGAMVTELDPQLLDASFVADRMDDEGFPDLLEAIRAQGQNTPILVRPHPEAPGRYQIVFGHRRVRAARELGRPVRAIIRDVTDTDHIIAQGQENSARANLSFIERALFAALLQARGHDRATLQAALSVDNPMLTRLLSVAGRVPEDIARAIGPARGVGRDRWLELAGLLEAPEALSYARTLLAMPEVSALASEERVSQLLSGLKTRLRPRRVRSAPSQPTCWQTPDSTVTAEMTESARAFALAFRARDGIAFGRYLAGRLDELYAAFRSEADGTTSGNDTPAQEQER